jgi:hypothetical protein
MDGASFLKTARAQIEASGRLYLPASLTPADALRLLEMAERWQAHEELCQAAADALSPMPSAPSDAMP